MDDFIPNKWVYNMLKQKESDNNMRKLNLDKRLTHKPFTIFDVEECQKYIGKEGLFSDNPFDFEDIKNCSKGTLTHLTTVEGFPFGTNSCDYKYFYPREELDWENEYKQFTLDSFLNFKEEYGEWFVIRYKSNKVECNLRYNGFRNTKNAKIADKNISIPDGIFLGVECYTFEELFERVELLCNGEWIPFGEKV